MPSFAAAALSLLLAATALADTEALPWIAAKEYVLPANRNSFRIAAALDDATSSPVELKTRRVVRGSDDLPPTAVTGKLLKENGEWWLDVTFDVKQMEHAGTYVVSFALPTPKPVPPARGVAPVPPSTPKILTLTLTQRAATVVLFAPATIKAVTSIGRTTMDGGFAMQETTGLVTAVTTTTSVEVPLYDENKQSTGAKLRVKYPGKIGTQPVTASVEPVGTLPIGKLSGKAVYQSTQLATPLDIPLEVISHRSKAWLLLTIVIAVAAGWFLRTRLDAIASRTEAQRDAEKVREELEKSRQNTIDRTYREAVEGVLDELINVLRLKSSVEELKAATQNASAAAKAAESEYEGRRTTVQQKLASLRSMIGDPAQQIGSLHTLLANLADALASQQQNFEAGIADIDPLTALERNIATEAGAALLSWPQEMQPVLDAISAWPELTAAKNTPVLPAPLLSDPLSLQNTLVTTAAYSKKVGGVMSELVRQAEPIVVKAIADLSGITSAPPRLPVSLLTLRAALEDVQAAVGGGVPGLPKLAAAVERMRVALVAALSDALPAKAPAPQEIADGKYSAALAKVLDMHETAPVTQMDILLGERFRFFATAAQAQGAQPQPTLTVRIVANVDEAIEGAAVFFRCVPENIDLAGQMAITWRVNGVSQYRSRPGELLFRYVPPVAGDLEIQAEVMAPGLDPVTVSMQLPVAGRSTLPTTETLTGRLIAIHIAQNVAAALFIIFVGYAIFAPSFIGNVLDFLGAALWGFTADVGFARVTNLASPLAAKSPFK